MPTPYTHAIGADLGSGPTSFQLLPPSVVEYRTSEPSPVAGDPESIQPSTASRKKTPLTPTPGSGSCVHVAPPSHVRYSQRCWLGGWQATPLWLQFTMSMSTAQMKPSWPNICMPSYTPL